MKRRDLVRALEGAGCVLHRHGKRHDVYRNQANGRIAPVPRHHEIGESLIRVIHKQLGIDETQGDQEDAADPVDASE